MPYNGPYKLKNMAAMLGGGPRGLSGLVRATVGALRRLAVAASPPPAASAPPPVTLNTLHDNPGAAMLVCLRRSACGWVSARTLTHVCVSVRE
jgi:hypothetical protein